MSGTCFPLICFGAPLIGFPSCTLYKLKMDMPTQTPYFSVPTKSNAWPENFFTWEKQSDQYLLSSSDKPVWPGKQHLLFNQNIVKVTYSDDAEIFSAYDNHTRLLAAIPNNANAKIIDL